MGEDPYDIFGYLGHTQLVKALQGLVELDPTLSAYVATQPNIADYEYEDYIDYAEFFAENYDYPINIEQAYFEKLAMLETILGNTKQTYLDMLK